jgi:hydrogenase large subunit
VANKIVIDPVTRIEGHLKIETVIENGVVKDARSTGNLFRGIELILRGRDPRDAQVITQRICGVCPQSHGIAAALNLDSAFGIAGNITDNARIIRNLIQGAHIVQDHLLHFYHLAALDFVDITDVAKYEGKDPELNSLKTFIGRGELGPFVPRYEGDYRLSPELNQAAAAHYVQALEIRKIGHEMVSAFSGKIPHSVGIIPGGVTCTPTVDMLTSYLWKLRKLQDFVNNVYIPDVIAVAKAYMDYAEIGVGCKNYLSYGQYDQEGGQPDVTLRKRLYIPGVVSADLKPGKLDVNKIAESVTHSWYEDYDGAKHPSMGETKPDLEKEGAYSWVKSPRYDGKVYEVGPLAKLLVNYANGNPEVKKLVDSSLASLKASHSALFSVLGRHLARAIDAKITADNLEKWILQVKPGEPTFTEYTIPAESRGFGLTDAARGALGHWIEIKDHKIFNYQAVVPTTWNASPKDAGGNPGPIEQAIIGTKIKDKNNPFEIVRIVRSFDPCLACAIH